LGVQGIALLCQGSELSASGSWHTLGLRCIEILFATTPMGVKPLDIWLSHMHPWHSMITTFLKITRSFYIDLSKIIRKFIVRLGQMEKSALEETSRCDIHPSHTFG
jgi:hypothetical protein